MKEQGIDEVESVLRLVNIDYVRQFWFGTKRVDFYLPDTHVALEIDWYYHDQPSVRRLDEEREQYLYDYARVRVVRLRWNSSWSTRQVWSEVVGILVDLGYLTDLRRPRDQV